MLCPNCGEKIDDDVTFCKSCGEQTGNRKVNKGGNIGWSDKINSPMFLGYVKKKNIYKFGFGLGLAIIAFIAFTVAGANGSMKEDEVLACKIVIPGMFLLIAIGSVLRAKMQKTWEGTVVDKVVKEKTEREGNKEDGYHQRKYKEYSVISKDDANGKRKIISIEKDSTFKYDYWKVGDRFKFHGGGLNGYEKYDKSEDEISFCVACNYLNDISSDVCVCCKCPILK